MYMADRQFKQPLLKMVYINSCVQRPLLDHGQPMSFISIDDTEETIPRPTNSHYPLTFGSEIERQGKCGDYESHGSDYLVRQYAFVRCGSAGQSTILQRCWQKQETRQ